METAEAFTDASDVFLLAAELGLYRVVSSCVGFRAPVDGMPLLVDYEDSKDRSTALHKSCANGHRQTADLLLKSRAIVDARNEDEETALALAAEAGKSEIINSLLAYGVDPRLLIGGQTIVIKMACSSGEDSLKHVEVVTMLLGVGVDVNAVDGSRHPALIWAVIKGKLEITRALMREPNADSNITSSFRWNTLHHLAQYREKISRMIAELLITAGTDPMGLDVDDWLPHYLAAYIGIKTSAAHEGN